MRAVWLVRNQSNLGLDAPRSASRLATFEVGPIKIHVFSACALSAWVVDGFSAMLGLAILVRRVLCWPWVAHDFTGCDCRSTELPLRRSSVCVSHHSLGGFSF